jgi:hypothetical protein
MIPIKLDHPEFSAHIAFKDDASLYRLIYTDYATRDVEESFRSLDRALARLALLVAAADLSQTFAQDAVGFDARWTAFTGITLAQRRRNHDDANFVNGACERRDGLSAPVAEPVRCVHCGTPLTESGGDWWHDEEAPQGSPCRLGKQEATPPVTTVPLSTPVQSWCAGLGRRDDTRVE